jgi:F-type H+-transporting ATPase subunit b
MSRGGYLGVLLLGALMPLTQVARATEDEHEAHEQAAEGAHEHAAHDGHGDDHGAGEINWMYGFFGERKDVEPSLLWRPEGMPVPFGAMLINSGILFFVLYRFGKQPVVDGLKKRRLGIMQGIEEAARMREEAKRQLAEHQEKLGKISQEIDRVREQMKEAAETERQRVLAEARERRERMERDAKILVEQELKAAREQLMQATATKAIRSAEDLIRSALTSADRQQIADSYLETLTKDLVSTPRERV